MKQSQMSYEEQEYLNSYDITMFERPSIAADIAAFSVLEEGERHNFRKLPEKSLKILLVRRASYPYKGYWALPGGFCKPGEDVLETAKRELYEETNISNASFQLAGIFGETDRDPRGWIISNTFLALMDGTKCKLRADTDAWEAEWFSAGLWQEVQKRECARDYADIQTEYRLELTCPDRGTVHSRSNAGRESCYSDAQKTLSAVIREYRQFRNYHETVRYEIIDSRGFAFDHAKIILHAVLSLRKLVEEKTEAVFHLMPERFTLTELQRTMELVQGRKLLTANFRRKIADYVAETEEISEGAGHRPAKLFERNVEAFYR